MLPDGAQHISSEKLSSTITSEPTEHEPAIEHRVSFFPILSEQRKLWLLTLIREECVTSLLDVGCGEGSLLWSLSNPAYWLPDTLPGFVYAHIRTLHGLDISRESLDHAKRAITPSPPSPYSLPRWEPLSASLWRGGLQRVNEEFRGIECIVASEVIEHLPSRALAAFAPVLLGYYAPRLLLLTTPSYLFNRLFTHPPTPGKEDPWLAWGWTSPTQPGRRMRHDDHQFEWTPAEAREWCTAVGEMWGYYFKLGGVGMTTEADPWGRTVDDDDEAGGKASLVVEFRRREGDEADARRRHDWEAWRQGEGASYAQDEPHERVATIEHIADGQGGRPRPQEEIVEAALQTMRQRRSASAHLGEIWDRVAMACGGSRAVLVKALDADPRFQLEKAEQDAQRWAIMLLGEEAAIAENWREEPVEDVREYSDHEHSGEDDQGYEEYWEEDAPYAAVHAQESVWEPTEVSSTSNWWGTSNENDWGSNTDTAGWGEGSDSGGWGTADSNEGGWNAWESSVSTHKQ